MVQKLKGIIIIPTSHRVIQHSLGLEWFIEVGGAHKEPLGGWVGKVIRGKGEGLSNDWCITFQWLLFAFLLQYVIQRPEKKMIHTCLGNLCVYY